MPMYTYRCTDHGDFERRESMDQEHLVAQCPECEQLSLRVFQAPPIHYNAQGFERTDNYPGNIGGGTADRKELLNTHWSRHFKESPPPPAKHVPKRE